MCHSKMLRPFPKKCVCLILFLFCLCDLHPSTLHPPPQGSLSEVEELQRKQALFEQTLEAEMEQVEAVQRLSQQLQKQKHYDSANIQSKSRALQLRSEGIPMATTSYMFKF